MVLNIHLQPIGLMFGGKSIMSHVLVVSRAAILVCIVCFKQLNLLALAKDYGSMIVLRDIKN